MIRKLTALFFPVLLSLVLGVGISAQRRLRIAPRTNVGKTITCHIGGGEPYELTTDRSLISSINITGKIAEEQALFDKVAAYTELRSNIYTVPVTDEKVNVEICPSDVNYIAYNASWLRAVYAESNNIWVVYAIIAHEVGHYVLNHDRIASGSEIQLELEADEYAGEILAKMGASLENAQAAFKSEKMRPRGHTHPPIDQRLAAVKDGWSRVRGNPSRQDSTRGLDTRTETIGVKTDKDFELRNLLKVIVSASDTGFVSLVGASDSRKDRFKSKVELPGAVETIVTPYHSVQAWMGYSENMADAEGTFNFLLQQLRLTFPDWNLEEKSPYVQQPIKSFVSTSPNGKTYISLYLDRRSGSSFFVKLNVFTRVKKP